MDVDPAVGGPHARPDRTVQGHGEPPSIVQRALAVIAREPLLVVTAGYILVSCVGLWSSWWFYRAFGVPIIDFMQAGDFLVAGLREPAYAAVLIIAIATGWLVTWPERWRRRDPVRAAAVRQRWWGPLLLPPERGPFGYWGMRPDTALVVAVVGALLAGTAAYSAKQARRVIAGEGKRVVVTVANASAPLPGVARLLGTTSGFAFLYWPDNRRVEAVSLQALARLRIQPGEAAPPRPERPPGPGRP